MSRVSSVKEPIRSPSIFIVAQVPASTLFQALPWKSTLEEPAHVVPAPALQSFLPARETPKHFYIAANAGVVVGKVVTAAATAPATITADASLVDIGYSPQRMFHIFLYLIEGLPNHRANIVISEVKWKSNICLDL